MIRMGLFCALLALLFQDPPRPRVPPPPPKPNPERPATPPERPETPAERPGAGESSGDRPAEEPTTRPAPTTRPVEGPRARPNLVPIPLTLPRPHFVGTPQNIRVRNLEKPLGRPRPPFLAPPGVTNVARGKPVTSSDEDPIIGDLSMVTDGEKDGSDGTFVELGFGLQHVQIDLGYAHAIHAIVVWHYHLEARVYHDVIVQVCDDPDFLKNVRTLFNNDDDNSAGLGVGRDRPYVETSEGKLIDAGGIRGRYVRLYSRGNTSNEQNHYVEVEVFGKRVE